MKSCSHCGNLLPSVAKFCSKCGTAVGATEQVTSTKNAPRASPTEAKIEQPGYAMCAERASDTKPEADQPQLTEFLRTEVDEYFTRRWYETARGFAALAVMGAWLYELSLAFFGLVITPWSDIAIDFVLYSVLSFLMVKGRYWALVLIALIKTYVFFVVCYVNGGITGTVIWAALIPYVWCVRALYQAHAVEQARRRVGALTATSRLPHEHSRTSSTASDSQNTLTRLNTRAWYRLLKVFYGGFLALIVIAGVTILYWKFESESREIDYSKTLVTCQDGTSFPLATVPDFAAVSEFATRWRLLEVANGSFSRVDSAAVELDSMLRAKCTGGEIGVISTKERPSSSAPRQIMTMSEYEAKYGIRPAMPSKNYSILIVIKNGVPVFARDLLTFFAVLLILFEAFRRLFYYIALGKWYPAP